MERAVDRAAVRYDRGGDQHYDVISAFIKSMRGSDADAALHYLARMIEAGEDPRFIARRLIVHASEDVGMADPSALQSAVAAAQAVEFVGLPEARINLAQAVIHVALAPKSNAVVKAINAAAADVRAGLVGPVPAHLRDASYRGAERLGHGSGYRYPHDFAERSRPAAVRARCGHRAALLRAVPARSRGQVRRAGRADQGHPGWRPGCSEPGSGGRRPGFLNEHVRPAARPGRPHVRRLRGGQRAAPADQAARTRGRMAAGAARRVSVHAAIRQAVGSGRKQAGRAGGGAA